MTASYLSVFGRGKKVMGYFAVALRLLRSLRQGNLLIVSLAGSTNRIFFWVVSFPVMASLLFVIFVIPLVVLFSLISTIRGGLHGH